MATNYVLQHTGKEIDNLLNKVSNLPEYMFQVVNELPTENINKNIIYLVQTGTNKLDEYVRIGNYWEKLGSEKDLEKFNEGSLYQKSMFIYRQDSSMKLEWDPITGNVSNIEDYTAYSFVKATDDSKLIDCYSYADIFDYLFYQIELYIKGTDTQTLTDGIYLVGPENESGMKQLYLNSSLRYVDFSSASKRWSRTYASTFGDEEYATFSFGNSKTTINTYNYTIELRAREDMDYDGRRILFTIDSITLIEHPVYATESFVQTEVTNLINSAPETLDTLGELATAIKENENIVEALNAAIGNKADKSEIPTLEEYATKQYVSENAMPASLIVNAFWTGTQEEYDALTEKSATTLYLIGE